jgi:uncharacterized protein with PQ loop repeat
LNMVQIVTALAAILAILWTMVQIVAYAREKNPKDIKIAIFLVILIGILLMLYPHLKRTIPGYLPGRGEGRSRTPSSGPTSYPTVIVVTTTPGAPSTPASPVESPHAGDPTGPSSPPTPTESITIPRASESPAAPSTEPVSKGELKSSFFINIKRNVLGGIGDIAAHCTFAEVGGSDCEIIAYRIAIHYLEEPADSSDKALTRSFDRTLKERIEVKSGSTVERDVNFDSEIGDLVLKSKKSGKSGWIRIVWEGKDTRGNPLSSESTANRPE